MTNKEFQKMVALFTELDRLIKKYSREYDEIPLKEDSPKPIIIPDDVYDEICRKLKIKEIGLLGVS